MRSLPPPHPGSRRLFAAVRWSLVALAAAVAIAYGCGGKSETPAPAPTTSAPATPAPAPDTTPSAPTTGADVPVAELGPKVFATRCALCHGADGHGDGIGSKALNPKPRNFHDQAYMATRTDAQLLEVIRNGKGAMPKWGAVLSEAEIKAALAHVRELGKKP